MTVHAAYRNGVFVPTEKVDLQENTEVRIITVEKPGMGRSAWGRHTLKLGGTPGPDFVELIAEMEEPLE